MSNTHLQPSMAAETQSMFGDLLRPVILASTLTTPGSGLTLPAFSASGYVLNGAPKRLVYVNQPAAPVTLAGGDGTYWLALMHDTYSTVASWNRAPGTHYAWLAAGTQPADPAGGLVLAKLTVAGGAITVVDTSPNFPYRKVAFGGGDGALMFDPELTYDESANILFGRTFQVMDYAGDSRVAFYSAMHIAGGTNRWHIYGQGDAPSYLGGALTVNGPTVLTSTLSAGNTTLARLGLGGYGADATIVLNVLGPSTLNGSVGVQGVPISGYSITTYMASQLAANVSVGMLGTPATATLDVNGSVRSRAGLTCDSNGYFAGNLVASGFTGLQGAADSRFSLRVYGATFHDWYVGILVVPEYPLHVGGYAYFREPVGIGVAPAAHLSLLAAGGIQASTVNAVSGVSCATLTVSSGDNFFGGHVGIGWPADVGYWLTATNIKTQAILWTDTSTGGFLNLSGDINTVNVLAGTQGYKPGGGAWAASSSRTLKRHIAPIPDALGLLLAQRGRVYEWSEPTHAALLPGPRYGFVADEVTIEQWHATTPEGEEALAIQGFEALTVEALRTIVERLEAIEGRHHAERGD